MESENVKDNYTLWFGRYFCVQKKEVNTVNNKKNPTYFINDDWPGLRCQSYCGSSYPL